MISRAHPSHRRQETVGKFEAESSTCVGGAWMPINRLIGSYLHHFLRNRFQIRAPERRNNDSKPRGWGTSARVILILVRGGRRSFPTTEPYLPRPGPAATMSCPCFPHVNAPYKPPPYIIHVSHPLLYFLFFIHPCLYAINTFGTDPTAVIYI